MATSPTSLAVSGAAKKRPLATGLASASSSYAAQTASKKAKHDHPLRQTSFPEAEAPAGLYGPVAPRSETGSVSNSLVSAVSGRTGASKAPVGRSRKRKNQPYASQLGRDGDGNEGERRAGDDEDEEDDDGSTVSGSHNSNKKTSGSKRRRGPGIHNKSQSAAKLSGGAGDLTTSGAAAAAAAAAAAVAVAGADDDDDLVPHADPNSSESLRLQSELAQEKEKIAKLQDALTAEQMARYVVYNRTKIKQSTLRRIVNQTVSQSVAPNPLQALQWVAKVFVGEIVEGARVVRGEWGAGWEEDGERERECRESPNLAASDEVEQKQSQATEMDMDTDMDMDTGGAEKEKKKSARPRPSATTIAATQALYPPPTNPHRGGLLPDHLREALRRYRAAGEGGGTGLGGHSFGLLGVKGEAVGSRGCLFR